MTGFLLRLGEQDERILNAVVLRRTAAIDSLMGSVTHLGDAWVTLSITTLLLLGWIPSAEGIPGRVLFTLVVSHVGVQILKRSIARERPRMPIGCDSLIHAPDRFSFPSGHAASSLSLALPLAGALPLPLAALALILGTLVGLSRCYLGVHYPGDVLVGWLLAALAALLAGPALVVF